MNHGHDYERQLLKEINKIVPLPKIPPVDNFTRIEKEELVTFANQTGNADMCS